MINPRLEDHVVGLELQLVELVEQRERATVQHRRQDAARIQHDVDALQEEMARTAEAIARADAETPSIHDVDAAGTLAGAA
ncbi:MAG: hypothetical protein ACRD0N_03270 [Acidimicrobiales bacterium]